MIKLFKEQKINFFIIASRNYLKGMLGDYSTAEYEIFCLKDDVKKYNFPTCSDNKNLCVIRLVKNEIKHFKKTINDFDIVQNTKEGKVYELKNTPFKLYYEKRFGKVIN